MVLHIYDCNRDCPVELHGANVQVVTAGGAVQEPPFPNTTVINPDFDIVYTINQFVPSDTKVQLPQLVCSILLAATPSILSDPDRIIVMLLVFALPVESFTVKYKLAAGVGQVMVRAAAVLTKYVVAVTAGLTFAATESMVYPPPPPPDAATVIVFPTGVSVMFVHAANTIAPDSVLKELTPVVTVVQEAFVPSVTSDFPLLVA